MISQDKLKEAVGWAALNYVERGTIVGVGTGSTVSYFIEALASIKAQIKGAISTSKSSTEKLIQHSIPVFDCNEITQLSVYFDGADEINARLQMIKGGNAALTSEKIVAAMADKFICIVDQSKVVDVLGKFPLPVEVIPIARSYVAKELARLGGEPIYRRDCTTEHGHIILDVHNLVIDDPLLMEGKINAIAGVVTVGLFAKRPADLVLIGKEEGVIPMTVPLI